MTGRTRTAGSVAAFSYLVHYNRVIEGVSLFRNSFARLPRSPDVRGRPQETIASCADKPCFAWDRAASERSSVQADTVAPPAGESEGLQALDLLCGAVREGRRSLKPLSLIRVAQLCGQAAEVPIQASLSRSRSRWWRFRSHTLNDEYAGTINLISPASQRIRQTARRRRAAPGPGSSSPSWTRVKPSTASS